MIRITLRLRPEVAALLAEHVEATGDSQNTAINDLLEAALEEQLTKRDARAVANAARDAVLAALLGGAS